MIIAIDGPSGTGKSSVSRAVATQLGAKYLDTGAMYRIATLHVLRGGIDPADATAVIERTADVPLQVSDDPADTRVFLAGDDVSAEIRGPEVTAAVSAVSAIPEVRENLVAQQRRIAKEAGDIVMEGRDIGTVVLVDAPTKVYLDARPEVRAQRRHDQNLAAGKQSDYDTVLADVIRRDERDSSRKASPLRPAEDATIIDTSDLTMDEVIAAVINAYQEGK
ncbi:MULTISPECIES: (d)CMP kinase [Corynebacterium]|uniref:Cytidylate kinase n=2 Tax=Corynebacterium glucuronolyticum TaxID=39791 RepID=A0A7T4EEB7_9CORY|nr:MULTISPECIES: (d)CMP kinase [Corynebacterium]EEI26386.1 cytidylate kinase [Corynebacterium glucuronolyticum ATCC 51867]EEI63196.1 cytidylate kinase [Corynebacterium glucuronolyticum ATCC 51866]MCT1442510.1 (d)CMP kinase [Corynebacterium glucuronolyticum]MCT1563973.1 (d)CMP kinase [Corynebacterium glucuronolyticum]OFO43409.1 cytidylate kinase [Corynebacterium sp. HMSC073D01]